MTQRRDRLKNMVKATLRGIDASVAPVGSLLQAQSNPAWPPIFIVGGPRSGSTLLSQLLLSCHRLAYINNAVALLPRSGPVSARLLAMRHWPRPSGFRNDYGDTRGLAGPSEAGDVWDAIFPWSDHHSVPAEELTPRSRERLQALVIGLSSAYRAPFLSKNLWNSVRIEAIDRACPNALFIVARRSPIHMAQSVLRGRRRAIGSGTGFWSIRPRELLPYEAADPVDHVARQLCLTYGAIESARKALGPARFLDVSYQDLCRSPAAITERFDGFLERHGTRAERCGEPPERFDFDMRIDLDATSQERLRLLFARDWPVPSDLGLGRTPSPA